MDACHLQAALQYRAQQYQQCLMQQAWHQANPYGPHACMKKCSAVTHITHIMTMPDKEQGKVICSVPLWQQTLCTAGYTSTPTTREMPPALSCCAPPPFADPQLRR